MPPSCTHRLDGVKEFWIILPWPLQIVTYHLYRQCSLSVTKALAMRTLIEYTASCSIQINPLPRVVRKRRSGVTISSRRFLFSSDRTHLSRKNDDYIKESFSKENISLTKMKNWKQHFTMCELLPATAELRFSMAAEALLCRQVWSCGPNLAHSTFSNWPPGVAH